MCSKLNIYLCSPKEYEGVNSLPLIEFEILKDNLNLNSYDGVIFTSKQAVIATNSINKEWIKKDIFVVGKATAKVAKELGGKNIFYPQKHNGQELAIFIKNSFAHKRLIHLRAKKVAFNLKDIINIDEEIIYKTKCIEYKDKKFDKNSIFIFTSPSTIECFFKNFKWDKSFKAVVIGKTTQQKLPKDVTFFLSDESSISSCIKKAYEIRFFRQNIDKK